MIKTIREQSMSQKENDTKELVLCQEKGLIK